MDVLFAVYSFALFGTSRVQVELATDAEDHVKDDGSTLVYNDRRIVRVTDKLVHSDILGKVLWFLAEPYIQGRLLNSYAVAPLNSKECHGIAVNRSETLLAVTNYETNELYIRQLPCGKLLKTITSGGTAALRFREPGGVCFGPDDDTLLVAEYVHHRVQEFELESGKSFGKHKRAIQLESVWSLCMSHSGAMLAVGPGNNPECKWPLAILDYHSGETRRVIRNQFASCVTGLCFTPDDLYMLATDHTMRNVKVLCVADGLHVRTMCEGLSGGFMSIALASNGDIVVGDNHGSRVCVFAPDGSTLTNHFSVSVEMKSSKHFKFSGRVGIERVYEGPLNPIALTIAGDRLYVIGSNSEKVFVFE